MSAYAVVNMEASGFAEHGSSGLSDMLERAFADRDVPLTVEIVRGREMPQAMSRAAASEAGLLIVGGGDGSIRTAAKIAMDCGKTLGIWPGGTLNRFAWDLNMPADLAEAAGVLAEGETFAVDVLDLNGEPVLCQCFLGLTPHFPATRQSMRGKPFGTRMKGYGQALRQIFRARRRLALKIDDGREARAVRALNVAVSNNPFGPELTPMPRRDRLDSGKLGLYVSRHRSGWEMVWLLVRAAAGDWREDPMVSAVVADQVQITSKASRLLASVDGDIERLRPPLTFRMRPRALKVIRPAA